MVLYQSSPIPNGPGVNEDQLHQATGLRNAQLSAVISSNLAGITGSGLIGTAGGTTAHGTWPTGLRAAGAIWNNTLPVPMTPTLLFRCLPTAIPGTVTVRIRMRGTDQFGEYIQEITPVVSKSMTTTSYLFAVTMSKVFATVDEVEVMTSGVNSTGGNSFVSIGWWTAIDPTRCQAGAFVCTDAGFQAAITLLDGAALTTNIDQVSTWPNWGVGTGLRLSPYGRDDPFPTPEILGATGIVLREKNTPTVINSVAKLPAFGQISVSGAAPTTGVQVGRSASGWNGCPHKFGFFSTNTWVTKIAGIELGGSSLRGAFTPGSQAQVGEDEIELVALIRTTCGTRRGSNRTRNYPNG